MQLLSVHSVDFSLYYSILGYLESSHVSPFSEFDVSLCHVRNINKTHYPTVIINDVSLIYVQILKRKYETLTN